MKMQIEEDNSKGGASKTLAPTFSGSFGNAQAMKGMTAGQGSSSLKSFLNFNQEQQLQIMKDKVLSQTKTI